MKAPTISDQAHPLVGQEETHNKSNNTWVLLAKQPTTNRDDWRISSIMLTDHGGPILNECYLLTTVSVRFPLEKGRDYLLFALRWHGRLEIDSCGNSALLSDAAKSIQQIRSIATTQYGEIEGWLAPETDGVDLSGIHVVIRSGSQVYRALTDKDGYFQFRAPKGSYVVDFSNHEYYLNGGDEFWYGPVRFRLHAGESAALQMVSVRHSKK